jgi:hypothetical protein
MSASESVETRQLVGISHKLATMIYITYPTFMNPFRVEDVGKMIKVLSSPTAGPASKRHTGHKLPANQSNGGGLA